MPWTKTPTTTKYVKVINQAFDRILRGGGVIFGQGINDGYWGCTEGLSKKYGPAHVFDTPVAEASMMGIAAGMSLTEKKLIYIHNRPDFLYLAMDQIINHAAYWRYSHWMESPAMNFIVWCCAGPGWGSGSQHSQVVHQVFQSIPGLQVCLPYSVESVSAMILHGFDYLGPTLILDHRRNFKEDFLPGPFELGPAAQQITTTNNKGVTILATSFLVPLVSRMFPDNDIFAVSEISNRPIVTDNVIRSIEQTKRVLIADTSYERGGFGDMIRSEIHHHMRHFNCPHISQVGLPNCPAPAAHSQEKEYYNWERRLENAYLNLGGNYDEKA